MGTLNVLYQSNENYAHVTGVSITSLLENNKDIKDINIFILNDNISLESISKLYELCKRYNRKLSLIDTQEILTKLKGELKVSPHKGTYTTYFKLLAIKQLPITSGLILQLDGDTIITSSLKELVDYNLTGYLMAATYDCIMNSYKSFIDIPLNDKYYNCGVLLIDREKWTKEKCEEQIIYHLKNIRNNYWAVDQDIINVLFRNRIKYLDLKFNFNSGFFIFGIKESLKLYNLKDEYYNNYDEIKSAYDNPIIYHCMGAMTGRPWEKNSIHPQNDLFNEYLLISKWNNFEKKYVNRSLIFKLQRMLYTFLPRKIYMLFHKLAQKCYLYNINRALMVH